MQIEVGTVPLELRAGRWTRGERCPIRRPRQENRFDPPPFHRCLRHRYRHCCRRPMHRCDGGSPSDAVRRARARRKPNETPPTLSTYPTSFVFFSRDGDDDPGFRHKRPRDPLQSFPSNRSHSRPRQQTLHRRTRLHRCPHGNRRRCHRERRTTPAAAWSFPDKDLRTRRSCPDHSGEETRSPRPPLTLPMSPFFDRTRHSHPLLPRTNRHYHHRN